MATMVSAMTNESSTAAAMDSNSSWGTTAASARTKTELEKNLDQMYQILMGLLIQLMQCGFAFLEAAGVDSKNTTNIVMKNTLDACVAAVAYWIIGYAFAFGPGNNFIGWEWFAMAYHPDTDLAHLFLQMVIAATCSTIVSGSVVGRCRMIAYIIYSMILTGIIYPVVTRWVWNPVGWLNRGLDYEINGKMEPIGFYDFSGSGAVHFCGGTSALVAAIILGPRIGRFDHGYEVPHNMKGHCVAYSGYGAMILLIGFMAFNGGSVLGVSNPGDGAAMSLSIVNTMIAAGCAGYSSLFVRKLVFPNHKWSVFMTVNGAVCGMVAICASCNVVRPWGALIIGVGAGAVFNLGSWITMKVGIDDPCDSVGIHFSGGLWGLIATPFLWYEKGILFAWDRRSGIMLAWQLAGICSIFLWTGVLSAILYGTLKYTGLFRVSPETEAIGADIPEHDEAAYQIHFECLTPELQQKLKYMLENMPMPLTDKAEKKGYIPESKNSIHGNEHLEIKVMNNMLPTFIPEHASNVTVAHRRASVVARHPGTTGNVNAAFSNGDGTEKTAL